MYKFIIFLFLSLVNISFVNAEQPKKDNASESDSSEPASQEETDVNAEQPEKDNTSESDSSKPASEEETDVNAEQPEKDNTSESDSSKPAFQEETDTTSDNCIDIKFELKSIGLGIGWTWGDGELAIDNQKYYFSANGLSLAEVGFAMISTLGKVCGLRPIKETNMKKFDISKLPGIYNGIGAGIAIIPGYGAWVLQNQNGVSITLNSYFHGVIVGLPIKSLILNLK
jgi:hypothetical protein